MTEMAGRIEIISAERVRDELVKLVCAPHPRLGLTLLVDTGLAAYVLPELPALALERDEHHRHKDVYEHTLTVLEQSIDLEHRLGGGPDFVSRFAALMHDVGKPKTRRFESGGTVTFHHHDVVGAKLTRKRMQALRFSNHDIDAVADAGRAAPALPRLRLGGVDRQCRTPLRPRRRRPARAAAHPHPRRLHDPQPAQGRPAAPDLRLARGAHRAAVRGGGARLDPARPRRQPDHGDPRRRSRPRDRRGLHVPPRAADGRGPAVARGRPRPRCARGGPRALVRPLDHWSDQSYASTAWHSHPSPAAPSPTRSTTSSSARCSVATSPPANRSRASGAWPRCSGSRVPRCARRCSGSPAPASSTSARAARPRSATSGASAGSTCCRGCC